MTAEEWTHASARSTTDGEPIDVDELDDHEALRAGRPAHATFRIRTAAGPMQAIEASAFPIIATEHGRVGRDGHLLAAWGERREPVMRLKVWGARGSVPAPGPQMNRYGGNTSCVQVTLAGGEDLILDAGTGIRTLGLDLRRERADPHPAHPPAPRPHPGPDVLRRPASAPEPRSRSGGRRRPRPRSRTGSRATSRRRCHRSRCASCPARSRSATRRPTEWEIGGATIRAEAVTHRGPTLGYRITDGDTTLSYIPDHEPALGAPLDGLEPEWISGFDLASDADLLIHDCQYTDDEYPDHVGWGHSALTDTLAFARRVEAPQPAALPPRSAALRRLPRRALRDGAQALERARRRRRSDRDGDGGRPSFRSGAAVQAVHA